MCSKGEEVHLPTWPSGATTDTNWNLRTYNNRNRNLPESTTDRDYNNSELRLLQWTLPSCKQRQQRRVSTTFVRQAFLDLHPPLATASRTALHACSLFTWLRTHLLRQTWQCGVNRRLRPPFFFCSLPPSAAEYVAYIIRPAESHESLAQHFSPLEHDCSCKIWPLFKRESNGTYAKVRASLATALLRGKSIHPLYESLWFGVVVCSLFACRLSASEAFLFLSGAVCWVFSNAYTKEEHLLVFFVAGDRRRAGVTRHRRSIVDCAAPPSYLSKKQKSKSLGISNVPAWLKIYICVHGELFTGCAVGLAVKISQEYCASEQWF